VNAKMNCFVDTNVLVYAIDDRSELKSARVAQWLSELSLHGTLVLSVQSLNELYLVGARGHSVPPDQLRRRIEKLGRLTTTPLDLKTTRKAWSIQDETDYIFWDCLLLASAVLAGCHVYLSEDLQHDRSIGSMRIVNPFIVEPSQFLSTS
jgi:predicted nucleic acid-binding protein